MGRALVPPKVVGPSDIAYRHIRGNTVQSQMYLLLCIIQSILGYTNRMISNVQRCRGNPVYKPLRPLARTISRTACPVLGGFTMRTPLLSAMAYSSCRRTWENRFDQTIIDFEQNMPTLTNSKASRSISP